MNACIRSSVFVFVVCILGCSVDCGNEVIRSIKSIDGRYTATFFQRNCGATTDYSRIVSLSETTSTFDPDSSESYVFSMKGTTEVALSWTQENILYIETEVPQDKIFIKLKKWKDIDIKYSPLK